MCTLTTCFFQMRALLSAPALPVLVLPLIFLMMACNMGSSQIQKTASFSLEYRLHKGLDCAMAQDCGFQIEISQTGALTRYEDTGAGTLTISAQRTLSQEQMNDLYQLLEETGFFRFPDLLPTENPKAGAGSVSVTYVAWPSKTSKSVLVMTGSSLPEEARVLMSRLDLFFSSSSSPKGREGDRI